MGLTDESESEEGVVIGSKILLKGILKSEESINSSSIEHTILRLGYLICNTGIVPLIFGIEDSTLLNLLDTRYGAKINSNYPPIVSRSNDTRVSTFILKET